MARIRFVTFLAAVLTLILATLPARRAQAETPRETANRLVKEGVGAARAGANERAAKLFMQAYELDPEPIVLRHIARVKERMGDVRGAIDYWERYGAEATDPAARREAVDAVKRLSSELPGQLRIDCAVAGAEVSVDGKPKGHTPLPGPFEVRPGEHVVNVVSKEHVPFERDVVVAPDAAVDVRVVLVPIAAPESGQRSTAWYRKWWVWTAAGAVVAGSVTAAVLATRGGGGSPSPNAEWQVQMPLEAGR